ncbi:MAG: hypothetical protein JNM24_12545 [Bdellovibrionaceae bacterium]|nr:hypothetical protein [Pseudobdellovibrionaceae bacterium]
MSAWIARLLIVLILPLTSFGNSCLRFYFPKIYSNDTAYGLQAFNLNLERIKTNLSKAKDLTDEQKIKYLLSSDTRIVFFRLQSLSRIYEKAYDLPFFTEKKDFFKSFEDLIGKVDLYNGLVATSKKLKQPRLVKYFEDKKSVASKNLLEGLEKEGFTADPSGKVNSVYRELAEFSEWKDADKDLRLHIKRLAKETRKLLDEVKDRKFTQDDIELVLHELRRKLRWPLIHIQTLNRLTTYNESVNVPADVQNYFNVMSAHNPKILKSGFLRMTTPDIKHPAQIPLIPHAMLTDIVSEIGTQKDKAEADIYIVEAMRELGFAARTRAKVTADLIASTGRTGILDHKALADKYKSELESSGLLLYYAEQLEKLNDIIP